MDNNQILNMMLKAVIVASGGIMNAQQLEAFILEAVQTSDFLKTIRVETNIAKQLDLDTMGLSIRALRKGVEVTAPNETDALAFNKRSLIPTEVVLYKALSYWWLMKALGGDAAGFNSAVPTKAEEQIRQQLGKLWMADVTDLFWNGDDESGNPFLSIQDGVIKKMNEDDDVEKSTWDENDNLIDVFTAMIDSLAAEYEVDHSMLRFYTSGKLRRQFKRQLAERGTRLGDDSLTKNEPVYVDDILIQPVARFPEDTIVLTLPDNLVVGWGTQMLVERAADIKKRQIDLVMSSHVDNNYVVSKAIVKYEKE